MPTPSSVLYTLRPDLSASVEEFDLANDREGFIGLQVLPVFEAARSAGTFGRIPIKELLQRRNTDRTARGGYPRGDWHFVPDSYTTIERGAEEPVDDNEVKNYRDYFDVEQICAQRAHDVVLREQEIRVADMMFDSTEFTTTAVTKAWNDYENAKPIDDINNLVLAIWEKTGLWPNSLILNRIAFRHVRRCAQVKDEIASQGAGDRTTQSDITAAMLSLAFDIPRIIVAGSPKNTANEADDAAIAPIWSSNYAMVARLCTTNDLREPGLGRTFHWAEDGSQIGGAFETYRDETVRGDVVRMRHQVGEKLIHSAAAQLLSGVVAA
jgi:hypothetical protein